MKRIIRMSVFAGIILAMPLLPIKGNGIFDIAVAHSAESQSHGMPECPVDVAKARERLEQFIFPRADREPLWLQEKWGPAIPELAEFTGRRQIQLLDDPQNTEVCRYFSLIHREDIVKKSHGSDENDPHYFYDVVYYRAGRFYFVVRVVAPLLQPDDPAEIRMTTARDLIVVYDADLNKIRKFLM